MKHRYWVDWEDPDFPHIRLIESATKDEEPLRLGQAKARIIEHFEHEIKHAKDQIRRVRLLRIADVDRWEQRQNRR